jgi:protein arginine N-methyltransferase 2
MELDQFFQKEKSLVSLSEFKELYFQSEQTAEILFEATKQGCIEICLFLLNQKIPWNSLNADKKSIGEVALEFNHQKLYEKYVQFGTRSEFILSMLGQRVVEDGILTIKESFTVSNNDYLNQKLVYSKDGMALTDELNNGVMMGWETPIMQASVDNLPIENSRVLNVGFGLGIIDSIIQSRNPGKHTIVEAHPDVYKKMLQDGWDTKPNVEILFGRWQDQELGLYDVIYFDTFGEYYDDLKEFHEILPNILDENGVYSFFNGLAGTNIFFHDVACEVCELDLREIGFDIEFKNFNCGELDSEVWNEIRRAYWSLDVYRLPIVTLNKDYQ